MLQLRPYQVDIIEQARKEMRSGVRSILIQSPTGSGKTVLVAQMLKTSASRGMPSLFIVHRRELIKQSTITFSDVGVRHGIIANHFYPEPKQLIQIAGIGTLAKRVTNIRKPRLIIWDECITGDSIIETNVGQIRMDSIPSSKATKVKSFSGRTVKYSKIAAFKCSGEKEVLEIETNQGRKIKCTENHLIKTEEGWVAAGKLKNGDQVLSSPIFKNAFYTALLLAMVRLDSLTKGQEPQELRGRILPTSLNGWNTKQAFYLTSALGLDTSPTKVLEDILLQAEPLVLKCLKKYIPQLQKKEKKLLVGGGFKISELKELLGGFAMTDAISEIADGLNLILKDILITKMCSLNNSLLKDMGIADCIDINEGTIQFDCQENLQEILSMTLESMSHCAWDINWEEIVSIRKAGLEKVYDISVDKTKCFFANGILVHNCHHCAAAGWSKVHAQFPEAYHIGITATPERLDGRGLGGYFKRIINGPSVRWLIDHGYLADYKVFAPSSINTEGLHTIMGDFVKSELASLVDKPTITGDAIKHYRKLADGKRAVVFCVSIEHSKHVVEQFQAAGISAAHVDGETPMEERDEKIEKFRYGIIKVIANVDLFGEGFDLPSLEVSILLRPTQSLGLFLQQSGRSLRPSCGKTHAVILDHAGNTMRHGLPDEERDWSLEGRGINKHGNKNKLSVRICPKCFAAQRSVVPTCAFCGFQFPIEGRQVKQAEGDLIEIDPKTFSKTRKREQGRSATLQDLIDLGRSRGYKRPELWAGFIFRAKQARKLAGLR